jgi:hypothetical protein
MPGKAFRSSLHHMSSEAFTGLAFFKFLSVVNCCWVLVLVVGCIYLRVVIVFVCYRVSGCRVLTVDCRASMSVVVLVPGLHLSDCQLLTVDVYCRSFCPLTVPSSAYVYLNILLVKLQYVCSTWCSTISFISVEYILHGRAGISGTQITVTYSKADTRSLCDLVFHPINIIY